LTRTRHKTGRQRRKHEEHANHEAWAIPYADLLTLLLAFFVVMYAISSVNAGKYRVLSDSLFAAFRGAPRTMEPIQVGDRQVGTGADMQATVVQQAMLQGHAQSRLAPVAVETGLSRTSGDSQTGLKLPSQAAAAAAALSHLADQIEAAMSGLVKKDMVTVRRNDFWIEVEMRTDVLFPSGSAQLATGAVDVIEQLGSVLAPFPNPVRVEGHTDNVPIKTAVFFSNWELSAARAGSVVRVLANHGVAPERLAVIGYGEQRPAQPNITSQGRNANRRVIVVILSTALMRQKDPSDPSSVSEDGQGAAPNTANPASAPSTPNVPSAPSFPNGQGSAIASPDDSPQAVPAPTAPEPSATAASAQTAATIRQPLSSPPMTLAVTNIHGNQHNTGMEPAP
jgi:chemotaxis protein MotB